MTNPFIPKDNYISRIADRLKKEEVRNWLLAQPHYCVNGKLLISKNVDEHTRKLIEETYKELLEETE